LSEAAFPASMCQLICGMLRWLSSVTAT